LRFGPRKLPRAAAPTSRAQRGGPFRAVWARPRHGRAFEPAAHHQRNPERQAKVPQPTFGRAGVEPSEVVELGDLLARHADAMIELRIVPNLWPLWEAVAASTLECSGIRLRNAQPPPSGEATTQWG
jgi:hypothetical protein